MVLTPALERTVLNAIELILLLQGTSKTKEMAYRRSRYTLHKPTPIPLSTKTPATLGVAVRCRAIEPLHNPASGDDTPWNNFQLGNGPDLTDLQAYWANHHAGTLPAGSQPDIKSTENEALVQQGGLGTATFTQRRKTASQSGPTCTKVFRPGDISPAGYHGGCRRLPLLGNSRSKSVTALLFACSILYDGTGDDGRHRGGQRRDALGAASPR